MTTNLAPSSAVDWINTNHHIARLAGRKACQFLRIKIGCFQSVLSYRTESAFRKYYEAQEKTIKGSAPPKEKTIDGIKWKYDTDVGTIG